MIVQAYTEKLKTKGHNDCVDITQVVQRAVARAKLRQGLATVFVTGSTAGVIPPPVALPKADLR